MELSKLVALCSITVGFTKETIDLELTISKLRACMNLR
jgi:hypothetical protein